MDNLTHTVMGLAAGALAASVAESLGKSRDAAPSRATFAVVGMVGGNLPDLDLLVSYGNGSIGYLLQHRGYTHTIVGCVALAVLLFGATLAALRWRGRETRGSGLLALLSMSFVAVFLHLGMDALNSYGVHPYWPFDDHWRFGDSVFIVEPWYWIAAAPLLFTLRARASRIALGLLLLAGLVAHVVLNWTAPLWGVGVVAFCAALVTIGRRARFGTAAWVSALLMACVTGAFATGHAQALEALRAQGRAQFPDEYVIDRVLTPSPTTPFCWDVLLLHRRGQEYVARHGMLAIGWQSDAANCPRPFPDDSFTAAWQPMVGSPTPEMHWFGQFSMPMDRLADLVRKDCRIGALLQFARAPFAQEIDGRWIVGDLRFDREPGPGFAELEVASGSAPCKPLAPWIAPRAEMLAPGASNRDR